MIGRFARHRVLCMLSRSTLHVLSLLLHWEVRAYRISGAAFEITLVAKITFARKVFRRWAKTACARGDHLVYLPYAGAFQNTFHRQPYGVRIIRGSSLMRISHLVIESFPEIVLNCLRKNFSIWSSASGYQGANDCLPDRA